MKTRLFEIKPLISKCFSRNDQLTIKGNKFGKLYSKKKMSRLSLLTSVIPLSFRTETIVLLKHYIQPYAKEQS